MTPLNVAAEDASNQKYIIGPNDVLEIKVWDNEDLHRTVEVSHEGAFTFPLIGRVYANGLSIFGLEDLVKKRLANGYIVAPQVIVNVKEYKSLKVFLLGEVKRPGSYVIKGKTHILELISQAGGVTDKAGQIITIVRPTSIQQNRNLVHSKGIKENEIITLDLSQFKADTAYDDFFVTGGDYIYVNAAPLIYVYGEVKRPGECKWKSGLTVRQAVILAGGPTQMASLNSTITIRAKDGKEEELKVNMEDLVVPSDIIKVPMRNKWWAKWLGQ